MWGAPSCHWLIHSPNIPTVEATLHPWPIPTKIKKLFKLNKEQLDADQHVKCYVLP
jgi:hypothetical protein